ncbi:patatin-like phospholipase family protein [Rhodobacter capsulatus]|uniref:Patatin-like phospholipase family protein n=1 Tax=Rhodobacter capsulatus TaxID=1061 RepID=A0A4V5PNL6_RHOCA|nr:patatin-like phospholipase family protein [Rhodobacter capsulatus]TKD12962.1 patatin-like phospholipase family protein [Rhodobacter capsulatus]
MTAPPDEMPVLVLQGGGALGAYQAGAFEELQKAGQCPAWVAGMSIGAINAAIICGNPGPLRVPRLAAFWETVSSQLTGRPLIFSAKSRNLFSEMASAMVLFQGVPGFFRPRFPFAGIGVTGRPRGISYYDTAPLRATLCDLIDFDYLAERGPRLSIAAVDVETGNFAWFDSARDRIGPDHVMASGALPPGFPAIEIDGRHYWDGGLVSNTPLQYVLENAGAAALCIFQVDLFPARGALPEDLSEVAEREKDIRFSSRTRLTTDRFSQLHAIRAAADRLALKLPEQMADDPDLMVLRQSGPQGNVTLVHLIHRAEVFESHSKDYDFSRLTMMGHWAAGRADVCQTFARKAWQTRGVPPSGLRIFDLGIGSKEI